MEKICEFCTALRPVVYCKADAAYLCLSCDTKVHSANALSNRHLRELLCDSCRNQSAYARCLNHRMFLCHECDQSIHGVTSQHQKRVVSSYMGCPSAKDFAALWGFDLDVLDKNAVQNQLFSTPCAPLQPNVAIFDIPKVSRQQIGSSSRTSKLNNSTSASGVQAEVTLSSKQTKISQKVQEQQNNGFILQQILDLKKLQLTEVDNSTHVMHGREETDPSSSIFETLENFDDSANHFQPSQDLGNGDSPLQELNVDSLPSPYSQPEHLPLSSTAANPTIGESSYWQCKSPVQSSQLWSQNMQDLGVCEDIVCHDDFNIPDVDTTFRNYEELFGTEQGPTRALVDGKDASCFSMKTDMSLDTSHNRNARTWKGRLHSPQTIRPSYSKTSFSLSRFSTESNGTEYLDSGVSPRITGAEVSCHLPELEGAHQEAKKNAVLRYKEKQKARMQEKQTWYGPRKARTDVRKREKSRVGKTEDYDSDSMDVTRSY